MKHGAMIHYHFRKEGLFFLNSLYMSPVMRVHQEAEFGQPFHVSNRTKQSVIPVRSRFTGGNGVQQWSHQGVRSMQQRWKRGNKGHSGADTNATERDPDQPVHLRAQQRVQQRNGPDQQVGRCRDEQAD